MKHKIKLTPDPDGECYCDLVHGTIFRFAGRRDDNNLYMKTGTRAFTLKGGEECSIDQKAMIVPLKIGTIITIIVGKCED